MLKLSYHLIQRLWIVKLFALLAFAAPMASAAQIVYVSGDAATGGNGASWSTAYRSLADAVRLAAPTEANPVEIWIKAGTYRPIETADRNATFTLKSYLALRGGFKGDETTPSQRPDPATTTLFTVLSGDIGAPQPGLEGISATNAGGNVSRFTYDPTADGAKDNSYNVLYAENIGALTLDRLVVAGGHSDDNDAADVSVDNAIYPTLAPDGFSPGGYNADLSRYKNGAGLYAKNSNLTVSDCFFVGNYARGLGGGISVRGGFINLQGNRLAKNVSGYVGGGISLQSVVVPKILSNTFYGNSAAVMGGAIFIQDPISSPYLLSYITTAINAIAKLSFENSDLFPTLDPNIPTDLMRVKKAALAIGKSLASSLITKKLINKLGSEALLALTASATPLTAAYGIVSLSVLLADLGVEIAVAAGVDRNSVGVKVWTDFSTNFATYATPGGLVQAFWDAVVPSPSFASRGTNIRIADFTQNHNKALPVEMVDNLFENNYSATVGGAVTAIRTNVRLMRCRFVGNQSLVGGGAVAFFGYSNGDIENSVMYQNKSEIGASVAYTAFRSASRFVNDTIRNNHGQNGYAIGGEAGADITIGNTILWNNTKGDVNNIENPHRLGGADVFASRKSDLGTVAAANYDEAADSHGFFTAVADIQYSNVQGLDLLPSGGEIFQSNGLLDGNRAAGVLLLGKTPNVGEGIATLAGRGNISVDPMLIGWYNLHPYSPNINAGSNAFYVGPQNYDINGVLRVPARNRVDIGAAESNGTYPSGTILYVDSQVSPNGNGLGLNWANAFKSLKDALAAPLAPGGQIWVAEGTYNVTSTMELAPGCSLVGGFIPGATSIDQSSASNRTIISGQSQAKVLLKGLSAFPVTTDGFNYTNRELLAYPRVIQNLEFRDSHPDTNTAAVQLAVPAVVKSCVFANHFVGGGGALSIADPNLFYGYASAKVLDSTFTGNGRAIDCASYNLEVVRSKFYDNQATNGGAAIYKTSSNSTNSLLLERNVFYNNYSGTGTGVKGGAVVHEGSSLVAAHNVFANNTYDAGSTVGGAGLTWKTTIPAIGRAKNLQFVNNIFYGNRINWSSLSLEFQQCVLPDTVLRRIEGNAIEGLNTLAPRGGAAGNVDYDPSFTNAEFHDFSLKPDSYLINNGTTYESSTDSETVINGDNRDIGAAEGTGTIRRTPATVTLTAEKPTESGRSFTLSATNFDTPLTNPEWEVFRPGSAGFVPVVQDAYHSATTYYYSYPNGVTTVASVALTISNPPHTWSGSIYRLRYAGSGYSNDAILQAPPAILYVDSTKSGDGTTWSKAFSSLPAALAIAQPYTQIWIREGTHVVTTADLPAGVRIYGGFSGTENSVAQRAPQNHPSILTFPSANQLRLDGKATWPADGSAIPNVIDSLTFSTPATAPYLLSFSRAEVNLNACAFRQLSGSAVYSYQSSINVSSSSFDQCGTSALYILNSSITVGGSAFTSNKTNSSGPAIYLYSSPATISDTLFTGNSGISGGAIYTTNGALEIHRSRFLDNAANSGGAIYMAAGVYSRITNALFARNRANITGGAISHYGTGGNGSLNLVQTTLVGNRAGNVGGAIFTQAGGPLINSIVWDNSSGIGGAIYGSYTSTNSHVQGQSSANFSPLFDPSSADYKLSANSPLLDRGGNDSAVSGLKDLAGADRFYNSQAADLGASEFQGNAGTPLFFTTPPSNVTVYEGRTASFTLTGTSGSATGPALNFTWEYDNGTTWSPISSDPGWTTSGNALSFANVTLSMDGLQLRATVPGAGTLPPVTLTVLPRKVLRVDGLIATSGDGTTWSAAFKTITSALAAADGDTDLWITGGGYSESSLTAATGTRIYVGFAGGESSITGANPAARPVRLTGAASYVTLVPTSDFSLPEIAFRITAAPQPVTRYVERPIEFTARNDGSSATATAWEYLNGSQWQSISGLAGWTVSQIGEISTLSHPSASLSQNGLQVRAITPGGNEASASATLTVKARSILYVDASRLQSGDGLTWNTAFKTIAEALAKADDGSDIWIAKGNYDERSLALVAGANLYSGFTAGATNLGDRNTTTNPVFVRGPGSSVNFNTVAATGFRYSIASPLVSRALYIDQPGSLSIGLAPGAAPIQWQYLNGSSWAPISSRPGWSVVTTGLTSRLVNSATPVTDDGLKIRVVVPSIGEVSDTITLSVKIRRVLFVDGSAPGGNGLAWSSAFRTLGEALSTADEGTDIWIADGTYTEVTLAIPSGTHLYGGFAGGETTLTGRASNTAPAILKGLAGASVFNIDLSAAEFDRLTLIDNITIAEGNPTSPAVLLNGRSIAFESVHFLNSAKAVFLDGNTTRAEFNTCSFLNNAQAIISNPGSTVTIGNTTFSSNVEALSFAAGASLAISGSHFDHNGRAISAAPGLILSGSDFSNNSSDVVITGNGTASTQISSNRFNATSVCAITSATPVEIADSTFTTVKLGLNLSGGATSSLVTGSSFSNGTDAIQSPAGLKVVDSDFTANARGLVLTTSGDAISTVSGGNFVNNTVAGIQAASACGVTNATFTGNAVGLVLSAAADVSQVTASTFSGNATAISSVAGLTVSGSSFTGDATGLAVSGGSLGTTVQQTSFTGISGTGILADSRIATDDVTFTDCALGVSLTGGTGISRIVETTFDGGVSALAITSTARAEVVDSQFTGLSGTAISASGTALGLNVYNLQFTHTAFTENTGVVFNSTSGAYKFDRTSITNNSAPGSLIVSGGGSLYMLNSLVAQNTATIGGSTLHSNSGSITIGASTIADNETGNVVGAVAGNIYNIRQSILWGNRASGTLARIDLMQADQANTRVNLTIIEGVQPLSWQQPTERNLPIDPLFNDPSSGDYQLHPLSPAIDAAGSAFAGSAVDLAGAARVQSSAMDFGAYESPFTRSASPLLIGFTSGPRTIVTGDSTNYSVNFATGNDRTIQWQVDDGSGNFTNLSADAQHAISYLNGVSRLTVYGDSALSGRRYRAVIVNGSGETIYASPASVFTVVSRPVYYVDANATGNGSGADWANAYTSLNTALTNAVAFSDIQVAAGTYRAPAGESFDLRRRQRLLGGWNPGTGIRNVTANPTILSSAVGAPATSVILTTNADQGVVDQLTTVDGFTFTSGGIGLQLPQASPIVRNCRFENLATGIYLTFGQLTLEDSSFTGLTRSAIIVYGQDSELEITGCSFLNNAGGVAGAGAIALGDASSNATSGVQRAYIADSIFRGNTGVRGGAISMLVAGTSVEIAGCQFTDNISTDLGGAIYGNANNRAAIRQSLFARNQSGFGAAIYCVGSASFDFSTIANNRVTGADGSAIEVTNGLTIRDSIVWGNTTSGTYNGQFTQIRPSNVAATLSDTIIQDLKTASGTRLLPFDPKFTDATNGNFTLAADSPAIGIAQSADLLPGETDVIGTARPAGAAADLGAYESAAPPAPVYAFGTLPTTLSGFGGTTLTLTQNVPIGYDAVWEYFNGSSWVAFPILGVSTGGPAGALSDYYFDAGVRQSTLRMQQITSALNGTQVRYVITRDGIRYPSSVTTVSVTSFEAIYVDANVSASGNGQSWSAAFKTLGEGLSAVTTTRRVIYVAKGSYRGPFILPMRFEMVGGFPSGGGLLADRNPSANEVILTGLPVVTSDPRASSVVRFLYSGSGYTQPILDGFTVENGQAGIIADSNVAPILRNLIVRGNTNSGVILPTAGASIQDSIFENNSGTNGGGIQANNAVTLDRVILRGNTATRGGGGYLLGDSVLRNVLVSGNVATTGGGLSISGVSPRLDQVTIAGNRSATGSAIYSDYGPVALRNSIVWGNRTPAGVSTTQLAASGTLSSYYAPDHSIVERSSLTTGVLAYNPLFNAPITAASAPSVTGNYTLNELSPAINSGSDAFASGLTTDLAGAARSTGSVDLGAYESATAAASPLVVTNESDSLFFNYNLVGNTFSLTAPAASAIVWQYVLPGSSDWATLVGVSGFSGANTNVLTVTNANTAFNGYRVRAVLTSANGGTAILEERTLTVYPPHLYVDANRSGSQPEDGLSWATAYRSLDTAIAAVPANPEAAEIWVADGTYTPNTFFNIRSGIAIYGGFSGNETELAQRNPSLNVTALVGKAGQAAIVSIPTTPAYATPVRLDSLTIRDLSSSSGAGINDESGRPLVIDRVRFTGLAYLAVRSNNANVTIRSSEFRGNGSPTSYPGIVTFSGSSGAILIENSLFAGNSSDSGAFTTTVPTIVRNVTIAHNFCSNAATSFTNNIGLYGCVIWGNRKPSGQTAPPTSVNGSTARNCVTENVASLESFFTSRSANVQADPKFTAPIAVTSTPTTAGDYTFGANSGAIDVGNNSDVSSPALDLAGNPRQHSLFIDAGAYEYQGDDAYSLATQPVDSTIITNTTLSVSTNYARAATYSWEQSGDNGATYSTISGTTASMLLVTGSAAVHDDLFRVRVQFNNGPLIVSNPARVSYLVVTASAGLPGGYAVPRTFTAVANAAPASWKWQFSTDGTTFNDVSGATTSSLAVQGDASFTNRVYRAIATYSEGPVITTNAVAFTYLDATPVPASTASGSIASGLGFGIAGGVQPASLNNNSLFVRGGLTGRVPLARMSAPAYSGDDVSLQFNPALRAGERVQVTTTSALRRADGVGARPRVWEFRTPVSSGPGLFGSAIPVGAPIASAFALGDLDGDGAINALIATPAGVQSYGNCGSATFAASGSSFGLPDTIALVLASFTSSGALDVAAITSTGDVQLWSNNGSGIFTLLQTLPDLSATALAFGDLDADGDLDLIVTTAAGNQTFLNNGSGTFTPGTTFGNSAGKALVLGDLDQDGDLDVIVTGLNNTTIYENNGAAAFTLASSVATGFDRLAIADFDANGLPDVALVLANAPATLWKNLGDLQFEELDSMPGGGNVTTLATGDVDGDDRIDLILTDTEGNTGAWLTSSTAEITRAASQPALAFGSQTELADLNGDGSLDLFGLDLSGRSAVSLYRITATRGDEDTTLAVSPAGFRPAPTTVYIRSLPSHGALLNGTVPVTLGSSFSLNQTANLTYRPAADYNDLDFFTWSDSAAGTLRTHWILVNSIQDDVVAGPDALALNQGGAANSLVGGATSVLTNDTNRDAGEFSATLLAAPAHGTLTLNADGTFNYVHDDTAWFSDSFTYRATNVATGSSDNTTVSISIIRHNLAPDLLTLTPVTYLTSYTGQAAGNIVATLAATDPDPEDAGQVTLALVSGDGSSGNADFVLEGTNLKTATVIDANLGLTRSIRVRATDSLGATRDQVFTISFFLPPTAIPANYTTDEDVPVKLTLGGAGGASDLNYQIITPPSHGTLARSSDIEDENNTAANVFIYTPDANYNGSDSFVYRVTDSNLASTNATITFTMAAVDDVPTLATIQPITIDEDSFATFTLVGSDAENSPLTYQFTGTATFGTVQLNGATVIYTPNANATGTEMLTFTVSDGVKLSAPLSVVIQVNPVNDPPVMAAIAARTLIRNTSDTFTAVIADVDNTEHNLRVGTAPQHGVVTITDLVVTYVPTAGYVGTDSYTLIANDGMADSAPVAVAVNINSIATENVASLVYRGLFESSDVPTATSGDWQGVLPENISTPAHGTVVLDGTRLLYTHNGDTATSDSFTYTLTNADDDIRTISVAVTIKDHIISVTSTADSGPNTLRAALATAERFSQVNLTGTTSPVNWVIQIETGANSYIVTNTAFTPPRPVAFDQTTPNDFSSAFRIMGKVTIDGSLSPGVQLSIQQDYQNFARYFVIPLGSSLVLKNIELYNGRAGNDAFRYSKGGNILNYGTFTGENVTFKSTRASAGSAIYNDSGTVSLKNCSFLDNMTFPWDDGVTSVVASRNGSIALNGVTFSGTGDPAPQTQLNVFGDGALATVNVSASTIGAFQLSTINGGTLSVTGLPRALADTVTRPAGESLSITLDSLLANDSGAPFDSVTVDTTSEKGGTITRNGNSLLYTAPVGLTATDSFYYRINLGGQSATGMVTIITRQNPVPVGNSDSAIVYRGLFETINVLANDSVATGETLAISAVSMPAHGTAAIDGNSIRYTHNGDAAISDSFTYSVSTSTNTTENVTVAITIKDRNLQATSNADSGTGTLRAALEIVNRFANLADAPEWTIQIVTSANQTWRTTTSQNQSAFQVNAKVTIDATASTGFKLATTGVVRNFSVSESGSLTLKKLTLLGSNNAGSSSSTFSGGAVLNYGTFIATAVTFQSYAAHHGAAIFNDGGTVSLTDSSFVSNKIVSNDVADLGGIVTSRNGLLSANGITFTSSTANPELYVYGDGSGNTATVILTEAPIYTYRFTTFNNGSLTTPGLPLAHDDLLTRPIGTSFDIPISTLLVNDSGITGTTLTVPSSSANGISLRRDGEVIHYEVTGYSEEDDTFIYTLTKGSFITTATVVIKAVVTPDISISDGDGVEVENGGTYNFGPIEAGSSSYVFFNISNIGDAKLTGISISIDGPGAADYQVEGPFANSLDPYVMTSMAVTFTPSENGPRAATLHISSNDPDESPFNIVLTGAINNAPSFDGYAITARYQTPIIIPGAKILAKASDIDGDSLALTSAGQGRRGSVSLQSNAITYTPRAGFSGDDTFQVTITDSRFKRVTGTVTVTVLPSEAANDVGANSPKLTPMSEGKMMFSFQGIPGRSYGIQRSTDLSTWTTLATMTAGPSGKMEFTDDDPPSGTGFYRLMRP